MCFKESVASIEVNRIRGYSRLCIDKDMERGKKEKSFEILQQASELLLVTAQNMECITEVTELRMKTQTNT